jgi:ABC-type cobalamin/Fe3+-siderophores transport system ATPase subunit
VVAAGPTDDILTPENIRAVYDVDAEILRPESAARVIIPIRRGRA